ncbi:MAG: S-adenosyl-l-methionine hydroxide adenosyltransferase family protein [Chlamydiota bacterium]
MLLLAPAARLANAQIAAPAPHRPIIVFMTDFGSVDDSVAVCKGVMLGIAPEARIVDLTHQVTPFSIADGARFLYGTTPYYPAGTVFVVVIDPTVGTSRKAIVVKSRRGQYFVLPDNGLMTMVLDRDGLEGAREITNRSWMIGSGISSTFHGRDIFSPVGAHLAAGEEWTQVGPELKQLVRLKLAPARVDSSGIRGQIIALDGPFGNLITNISGDEFLKLGYVHGDKVHVRVGDRDMVLPFVRTFGDVPLGEPLIFIDSRGRFSLAVNQRSFAQIYNIKPPVPLFVPKK